VRRSRRPDRARDLAPAQPQDRGVPVPPPGAVSSAAGRQL